MLKSDVRKAVERVLDDHEIVDRDLKEDLIDAVFEEGDVEDDEEDLDEEDPEFDAEDEG